MTTNNDNNSKVGFGGLIAGMLGVAFVVLKLCKVIDWSWWWVLLPFWFPLAIVLLLLAFLFVLRKFF